MVLCIDALELTAVAYPREAEAVGRELQARLLWRSDAAWEEKLWEMHARVASASRLGPPAPAPVPSSKLDARLVQMQEESVAVPFVRIWLRGSEALPLPSQVKYFLAFSANGKKVSAASLFLEKQVAALLGCARRIAGFRVSVLFSEEKYD